MLARRAMTLEEEITELGAILKPLVKETAPELVATLGIGTDAPSALLVAAGDNPERLRNEAAFAHLCGVSPIEASSGKQHRHRLNRSGDRQANSALWHIVITRMVYDPRTTEDIDRRTKEGLSNKESVDVSSATSLGRFTDSCLTSDWGLTPHRSTDRGQSTVMKDRPVRQTRTCAVALASRTSGCDNLVIAISSQVGTAW